MDIKTPAISGRERLRAPVAWLALASGVSLLALTAGANAQELKFNTDPGALGAFVTVAPGGTINQTGLVKGTQVPSSLTSTSAGGQTSMTFGNGQLQGTGADPRFEINSGGNDIRQDKSGFYAQDNNLNTSANVSTNQINTQSGGKTTFKVDAFSGTTTIGNGSTTTTIKPDSTVITNGTQTVTTGALPGGNFGQTVQKGQSLTRQEANGFRAEDNQFGVSANLFNNSISTTSGGAKTFNVDAFTGNVTSQGSGTFNNGLTVNGGAFTANAGATVNGGFTSNGPNTLNGATTVNGGGLTVNGGLLTAQKGIVSNGPNTLNGATTINGGGLTVNGGAVVAQKGLTSNGATNLNAGATVNGGVLTANAGAVVNNGFTSNGNAQVNGTTRLNGDVFVTSGNTVDVGGNRIQNVATPILGTDAVNKDYVDGGFRVLSRRIDKVEEGVAIASALANPDRTGDQTWAVAVNWGNFEGSNAVGISGIAAIGHDFFGVGDQVSLGGSIGFGTDGGQVGGRVSLQIAGGGRPVPLK
jgi:hypothetical protein